MPAERPPRPAVALRRVCRLGLFVLGWMGILAALPSCRKGGTGTATTPAAEKDALVRVGSIVLYQSDLDHELAEKHAGRTDEAARKKALEELVSRAQLAQAGLDAGLDRHPAVRAQMARALGARLREEKLTPRLKELTAAVPEARLRELYAENEARFRSEEKRQAAVLWLNPRTDPARRKTYEEKLTAARDFFFKNGDLKDRPEQGFSVLSVDHSEHAASRFRGGVVEWLSRSGGVDPWSKAVAEIVFGLNELGEVSPVISKPEGVFLVRYVAVKPAVLRPFESVKSELERMDLQSRRAAAEAEFDENIRRKYPAQWLAR